MSDGFDAFRFAGSLLPFPLNLNIQAGEGVYDLSRQFLGDVDDSNRPGGSRATLGGKSVIWDPERKRWIADRPEGYGAPIGGKPHVWDTASQTWKPMPGAATQETPSQPPRAPDLPPSASSGGTSTGTPPAYNPSTVDTGKGMEGTQPTPQDVFSENRKLLEMLPGLMEQQFGYETKRAMLTGILRDRGLRELSRRAIEQENIKAWADVRKAQELARSNQAIALANTAFLAQTPNQGLMSALSESMKASMAPVQMYAPGGSA